MTGKEIFELSKLISSEGYDCIVETIFSKLDPLSLAQCRLVSKAWRALIDNRRSLLVHQLRTLKRKKLKYPDAKSWYKLRRVVQAERKWSVIELFPEFKQAFLDLERNANESELQIVVVTIRDYVKVGRIHIGRLELSLSNNSKRISISPMHQAITNGNQEFIRIFMKRTKFDFQSPMQYNGLRLTTCLGLSVHNQNIVQLFLKYGHEKGLNLNLPGIKGRTALHYACLHGPLDVVKLFLEHIPKEHLEVNTMDKEGSTPFHLACYGNQLETVQLLLELSKHLDININARNRNGLTPLHFAAKCGHDKVVKVLLEASLELETNVNAFVNAFDLNGKTPFTMACIYGHFQVVKLMIEESRKYQIDLNLSDNHGVSSVKHAIVNGHLDIVNMMIDKSKDEEISLNTEGDYLREKWFKVHNRMKAMSDLVFGRRPDHMNLNPLLLSSLLTFSGVEINIIMFIWLPVGVATFLLITPMKLKICNVTIKTFLIG